MSSPFRSLAGALIALAVVLGAAGSGRTGGAAAVPVCVDASSPSAQLDQRIAIAALQAVGSTASIVRFDGSHGVGEKYFRYLAREQCSLVMGFPVDATAPDPPDGLKLTAGYYRTGYVLASLGPPRSLRAVGRGAVVAVQLATAPDFYLVGAYGATPPYRPDVYQTQDEAIGALVHQRANAVMAWEPSIAHYQITHTATPRISVVPLAIPHAAWSLAALYDPRTERLARRFQDGVERIKADGQLDRIERSLHLQVST